MDGLFLTSRRHWWEHVNNTVIESHLSETSGSYRARTWMDHVADRDATYCAISPPPRVDELHHNNANTFYEKTLYFVKRKGAHHNHNMWIQSGHSMILCSKRIAS